MNDKDDALFEIAWRELLIKRLTPLMSKLKKTAAAEKDAAIARQSELRANYPDVQSAQDAYGYGYITEAEYDEIRMQLYSVDDATVASAARDELADIIRRLKTGVKDFKWSMLSDEEKDEIRRHNTEHAERLHRMARGSEEATP